jgi:hypothetical protein
VLMDHSFLCIAMLKIKSFSRLRFPDRSGHLFHAIPATDSMAFRPPIPEQTGR